MDSDDIMIDPGEDRETMEAAVTLLIGTSRPHQSDAVAQAAAGKGHDDSSGDDEGAREAASNKSADSIRSLPSVLIGPSVTENGRRYANDLYYLPNDDTEETRLAILHQAYLLLLSGECTMARLLPHRIRRVLDVGAGAGDWAITLAERLPGAEIFAIDISPIPTAPGGRLGAASPERAIGDVGDNDYNNNNNDGKDDEVDEMDTEGGSRGIESGGAAVLPPNVFFQIDDARADWTYSAPFDFVLMRGLAGAFTAQEWARVFAQAYRHLNPDGIIEVSDWGDVQFDKTGGGGGGGGGGSSHSSPVRPGSSSERPRSSRAERGAAAGSSQPADNSYLAIYNGALHSAAERAGTSVGLEHLAHPHGPLEAVGFRVLKAQNIEVPLGTWSRSGGPGTGGGGGSRRRRRGGLRPSTTTGASTGGRVSGDDSGGGETVDEGRTRLGRMALVAALEGLEARALRLLTTQLNWTPERVRELCDKVQEEMLSPGARPKVMVRFLVARKLSIE